MASAMGNPLEDRLRRSLTQQSENVGFAEPGALEPLIARAAANLELQDVSDDQLEGVEMKLGLLVQAAALYQREAAERGRHLYAQAAMALALKRLCPIWPFC